MAARMIAEHEAGALAGVYGEIRTSLGLVPNVFKAMAAVNHDVLLQNWTAFRYTVLEGALPRVLKEMVGLVVSLEEGNDYTLSLCAFGLASLGVAAGVVRNLMESGDCPEISHISRVVLHFARDYARDPEGTTPEPLEAVGLSDEEAQEVMDTVLLVTGMNRFAREIGLPADVA
ncbi:MAG TPA: hypothetical protein VK464_03105 [Symbiobacteriaceae bacterium]|nr:hypothetical protein [Symbiobacteriaceae bacterium]